MKTVRNNILSRTANGFEDNNLFLICTCSNAKFLWNAKLILKLYE